MGRGKDDELNARRRERKVRKEVRSARRRQPKFQGGYISSFDDVIEAMGLPAFFVLFGTLMAFWWSYWLSPYLWPDAQRSNGQGLQQRTHETHLFQVAVEICLDPESIAQLIKHFFRASHAHGACRVAMPPRVARA